MKLTGTQLADYNLLKKNIFDVPSKTSVFGVFLRFKPDKGLAIPTIVPTSRQVYSIFYNETIPISNRSNHD